MIIRLTEDFSLIKLSAKIPTFGTNCARFKTDVSNSFSLKKKYFSSKLFNEPSFLSSSFFLRNVLYAMLGTISKRYSNSSVFPERKGKETIELFPSWNSRSNFGKILSRARILEGHFWISSNKSYRSAVSAYNTWCKKKKSILGRMAWKFSRLVKIGYLFRKRKEREKNWQIRSREYRSVVEFNERSFNEGSTRCCSRVTCLLALFCQEIDAPTLQRLS